MAMKSANGIISISLLRRVVMHDILPISSARSPRYFSGDVGKGKGGVLDDKERAQETIFIQKMERERLQKMKSQMDKENVEKGKDVAEKKSKDETQKD